MNGDGIDMHCRWNGTAKIWRVDDSSDYSLLRHLEYTDSEGTKFVVRKGFTSDGASIPRFLRWWVGDPWTGEYVEAAILHDAMCRCGWYELDYCDDVMAESMAAHGTPGEIINAISAGLAIARLWRRKPKVDPDADRYIRVYHDDNGAVCHDE